MYVVLFDLALIARNGNWRKLRFPWLYHITLCRPLFGIKTSNCVNSFCTIFSLRKQGTPHQTCPFFGMPKKASTVLWTLVAMPWLLAFSIARQIDQFAGHCTQHASLFCTSSHELIQGPLMKWTEHFQELQILKIYSRGAPITPQGWKGGYFFGP